MPVTFDTPIEYLKGVGPQRAETLKKELNIYYCGDLLNYFPFRYIDRSKFYSVSELVPDMPFVQLRGKIISVKEVTLKKRKVLNAVFKDDTGTVDLIWFAGINFIRQILNLSDTYILFGKPNFFKGKISIPHPELEAESKAFYTQAPLRGIYHSGEKLTARGLNTKGIEKVIQNLLPEIAQEITEFFPQEMMEKYALIPRREAFENIHFPKSVEMMKKAIHRLKFEELFFLQLQLARTRFAQTRKIKGFVFSEVGEVFNDFYNHHLPFPLTNAQKRVIKEIRKDIGSGIHMNRLVQGDVGSGKTVVALLCMLIGIGNGYQSCLMAPTEILATQHYHTLVEMLQNTNVTVRLLTGSTKTAERKQIAYELETGALNILIGTHALIEPKVKFKNLGFVVIDEQHRFGVEQRSKLWRKNVIPPHVLVMTATPIPRTLAMTLYGDLDISVIDEMPPGRKPIVTSHRFDSARIAVFNFMEEQIKLGRQVYVVYPLIQESEAFDYKDLMDGFESISRRFPLPQYNVSIVHGKMASQAKELEMQRFAEGKSQILVATTVIEVGVNVPNATVMVIESAERFGLSQLHQLRGRVGRGGDQSYCILMTGNKLGNESRKRMKIMVETNDGFIIAEEDLKMRGPGDLMGTQQSGILDLRIADLAKDDKLMKIARDAATDIIEKDVDLQLPEHREINFHFMNMLKRRPNWSRIS